MLPINMRGGLSTFIGVLTSQEELVVRVCFDECTRCTLKTCMFFFVMNRVLTAW